MALRRPPLLHRLTSFTNRGRSSPQVVNLFHLNQHANPFSWSFACFPFERTIRPCVAFPFSSGLLPFSVTLHVTSQRCPKFRSKIFPLPPPHPSRSLPKEAGKFLNSAFFLIALLFNAAAVGSPAPASTVAPTSAPLVVWPC